MTLKTDYGYGVSTISQLCRVGKCYWLYRVGKCYWLYRVGKCYWLYRVGKCYWLYRVGKCYWLYRVGKCYWWRKTEYPEKTTDLSRVTDKFYRILLYGVHVAMRLAYDGPDIGNE
jgi:hypothetical protein